MIFIFPTIKSSNFQRLLFKAPAERFLPSTKGPKVPHGLNNIIPSEWPAHFDGIPLAEDMAPMMSMLYQNAAYTIDAIKRTKVDSRFTAEGAKSRCLELVNEFIVQGRPDHRGRAQKFRNMIEENASRLITELELTRPEKVETAIAAEWRSLIRNSEKNELGRKLFLIGLMQGGEHEAGLSVLGAGRSLSGLSQEVYDALSGYVKVASNIDPMARIWNEGQILDSARLALVRTVAEMVRLAGLPTDQTAAVTSFAEVLESFNELKQRLEAIDKGVGMFKGSELPQYVEPEPAPAPAPAPAGGA